MKPLPHKGNTLNYVGIKNNITFFLSQANLHQVVKDNDCVWNYYKGDETHPIVQQRSYFSARSESDIENYQPRSHAQWWKLGDELSESDDEYSFHSEYSEKFNAALFMKIYFALYFQNKFIMSRFTPTQYGFWNPLRFIFSRNLPSKIEQKQSKQWIVNHALNFIICAYNQNKLFHFLKQDAHKLLFFYNTNALINCLLLPNEFSLLKDHLLVYLFTLSRSQRRLLLSDKKLNHFKSQIHFNATDTDTVSWINQRYKEIMSSSHYFLTQLPLQYTYESQPTFSQPTYQNLVSILQNFRESYDRMGGEFFKQKTPLNTMKKGLLMRRITPLQKRQIKKAHKMGFKLSRQIAEQLNAAKIHIPYAELKKSSQNEQAFFRAVKLVCSRKAEESIEPRETITTQSQSKKMTHTKTNEETQSTIHAKDITKSVRQ
jgi:hypothetical protein